MVNYRLIIEYHQKGNNNAQVAKQLNVGAEYLLKANGTIEFLAQCLKYENVDEIVKKINEGFVDLTTIG